MNRKKTKTLHSLFAFALAIMMIIATFSGFIEVKAAGIAPNPTITSAAAGSKEIKGGGLLGSGRRRAEGITTIIYVIVKNGDTTIEQASTTIEPKDRAREWIVNLQNALEAGQTVYVKQQCNTNMSEEVSAEVKETMAGKYKDSLKMPTGDLYLEDTTAALVSKDEAKELLEMVKDANPTLVNDIESAELKYSANATKGTIVVTYTDGSSSEEINADNLNLVQITETSRGYILDPYNVVSDKISGKLAGQGPFDNIKVQIIVKVSQSYSSDFKNGSGKSCIPDKNSSHPIELQVDKQTGRFSYTMPDESVLQIGKILSISVKEPKKFMSCNIEVTEIAMPKITDVKDPKKIKPEEKEKIAQAIRDANTTESGISKLPDGTGDKAGIPAYIEITDDGKVKVINPNDVDGTWDNEKFIPKTNNEGTYVLKPGKEVLKIDKPDELVNNLPPDSPKLENKNGKVTVTPNIEVDTDAKIIEVEYEDTQGNKKTIKATREEVVEGS